jgi:hypothetical protein
MEKQMHQLVNECLSDLEEACAYTGESLSAEGLADFLQDSMHDKSAEFRALPNYEARRAVALKVARQYA